MRQTLLEFIGTHPEILHKVMDPEQLYEILDEESVEEIVDPIERGTVVHIPGLVRGGADGPTYTGCEVQTGVWDERVSRFALARRLGLCFTNRTEAEAELLRREQEWKLQLLGAKRCMSRMYTCKYLLELVDRALWRESVAVTLRTPRYGELYFDTRDEARAALERIGGEDEYLRPCRIMRSERRYDHDYNEDPV